MTISQTKFDELHQVQTQKKSSAELKNEFKAALSADATIMGSMMNWKTKLYDLYDGSGFTTHEEIPAEAEEQSLTEKTRIVSQREFGFMEMTKAKREYRSKRQKAIERKAVVDAYYHKINQEELAVQGEAVHHLRDERDLAKLFTDPEEKQTFFDDCASGEQKKVLAALERGFEKLKNADFSIFTYKNDDDLFKNYEQKKRLMEAGHVLKRLLSKYMDLGGAMDNAHYMEMLALADFYEQQEIMYTYKTKVILHPQYLSLREKDLSKLSWEQINEKADALKGQIAEKKKTEGESDEVLRLQNLHSFLENLATEKLREKDIVHLRPLKKGEDAKAHLQLLKDLRQEVNVRQWTKNLKDLDKALAKRTDRRKSLFTDLDISVKNGIWKKKGLQGRWGTHGSLIELIYLQRHQKSLADLDKPENLEDLKKIRDEVEQILHSQEPIPQEKPKDWKESEKDVNALADLFADMIRGYIRQFSVIGQKVMYRQFYGISQMTDLSLTTLHSGWGDSAATNMLLGNYAADLYQISEANEKVTRMALSKLTKEEIELYRKSMAYADNTGGAIQAFHTMLGREEVGLGDSAAVTEEKVKDLVTGKMGKDVTKIFQGTTWFLSSYKKCEKDMDTRIPKKDPWVLHFGAASFMNLFSPTNDTLEKIYAYAKGPDCEKGLKWERDTKIDSEEIVLNIKLKEDGTVAPPEGY